MPKAEFYNPYLSASVADFLFRSPQRTQRHLLTRIAELGRNPFGNADYLTWDEDGRETCHLRYYGTTISYTVDHAAKQVLILDLRSV